MDFDQDVANVLYDAEKGTMLVKKIKKFRA
jgi:hypothetical protein